MGNEGVKHFRQCSFKRWREGLQLKEVAFSQANKLIAFLNIGVPGMQHVVAIVSGLIVPNLHINHGFWDA
jgi:hypothetical protein